MHASERGMNRQEKGSYVAFIFFAEPCLVGGLYVGFGRYCPNGTYLHRRQDCLHQFRSQNLCEVSLSLALYENISPMTFFFFAGTTIGSSYGFGS